MTDDWGYKRRNMPAAAAADKDSLTGLRTGGSETPVRSGLRMLAGPFDSFVARRGCKVNVSHNATVRDQESGGLRRDKEGG